MNAKRPTLALLALAGVLAAVLGAAWFPASPAIAAPVAYIAAVLTLAHATHLPPGRTLIAATLLTLATVALLLRSLRYTLDLLLWFLVATNTTGITALKAATR